MHHLEGSIIVPLATNNIGARTRVSTHSASSTRRSEEHDRIAHDLDVVQQSRALLTGELRLGRVQRDPAQRMTTTVSKRSRQMCGQRASLLQRAEVDGELALRAWHVDGCTARRGWREDERALWCFLSPRTIYRPQSAVAERWRTQGGPGSPALLLIDLIPRRR